MSLRCHCLLVKKSKERVATKAEFDVGQISLFGTFSQSSHGSSGKAPSLPPRCKRRHSSNHGHEVDNDDNNDNDEDVDGGGDGGGGSGSGGRGGGGKCKRG